MALVTIKDSLNSQRHLPWRTSRERDWGEALTVDEYARERAFLHTPEPRDHHILICFTSGGGQLEQRRDGRSYRSPIQRGDVLVVPAGQSAAWKGDLPDHLRLRVTKEQLDSAWEACGAKPSKLVELASVLRTRDPFLAELAGLFSNELASPGNPAQQMIAESATTMVTSHLVRQYCVFGASSTPALSRLSPWVVRRITDYVEAHLQGTIYLHHLADLVGISTFHFGRAFKATTGVSPMQFVEVARMRRAYDLLKASSGTSIEQVGRSVGFTNASHFARRFAAYHQQTPSTCRNAGNERCADFPDSGPQS